MSISVLLAGVHALKAKAPISSSVEGARASGSAAGPTVQRIASLGSSSGSNAARDFRRAFLNKDPIDLYEVVVEDETGSVKHPLILPHVLFAWLFEKGKIKGNYQDYWNHNAEFPWCERVRELGEAERAKVVPLSLYSDGVQYAKGNDRKFWLLGISIHGADGETFAVKFVVTVIDYDCSRFKAVKKAILAAVAWSLDALWAGTWLGAQIKTHFNMCQAVCFGLTLWP
jgi:hypothetical protein